MTINFYVLLQRVKETTVGMVAGKRREKTRRKNGRARTKVSVTDSPTETTLVQS